MKYCVVFLLLITHVSFAQQRIVSAGGTLTEIIFALEKQQLLVAVDQSSLYPPSATTLAQIGYYRDLAAEGVLSTRPTTLLALEGTGRPQALTQIAATGVTVVHYKKPTTVAELLILINTLGDDLNAQQQANTLIQKIKSSLPAKVSNTGAQALFLLSSSNRGLVAAGKETVPDMLFNYAGITNIAATHSGFKALNTEQLVIQQPDFIVAPHHVVEGFGGKDAFCQQASLQLLKAAQNCHLLVMDSLLSLGMTPRVAQGIKQINAFNEQL
ncbi:hemin ABC transporter substrate-binding protein [Pseudoalteromonas mariniglutinosa]|uniref:heme/hemin ABC transporter substrate-binding protein n=1 Tax=Pseudoalteromonas mariniglutinosa TaxID=206042 RepID=UPI00384E97FA